LKVGQADLISGDLSKMVISRRQGFWCSERSRRPIRNGCAIEVDLVEVGSQIAALIAMIIGRDRRIML
jgi:hypothetical protein